MADAHEHRDTQYVQTAAEFGEALVRLARVYESDPDLRRDLLQDIHFELWRSLARFAGQCSLRTWVYRVAHNVAISRSLRRRRRISSASMKSPTCLRPNPRILPPWMPATSRACMGSSAGWFLPTTR